MIKAMNYCKECFKHKIIKSDLNSSNMNICESVVFVFNEKKIINLIS